MWIVKGMGFIIVMMCSTFMGFYYGNREAYRIRELREFKRAVVILKSEIEYIKSPLVEALYHIAEKTKKPISTVFESLAMALEAHRGEDVYDLWFRVVQEKLTQSYLAQEDLDHILTFGKCLGYLDIQLQMNNIHLAIEYIDEKIQLLQEQSSKNKKTFQSLGVLSGLMICILFS